jgi:hypothetical protein
MGEILGLLWGENWEPVTDGLRYLRGPVVLECVLM